MPYIICELQAGLALETNDEVLTECAPVLPDFLLVLGPFAILELLVPNSTVVPTESIGCVLRPSGTPGTGMTTGSMIATVPCAVKDRTWWHRRKKALEIKNAHQTDKSSSTRSAVMQHLGVSIPY